MGSMILYSFKLSYFFYIKIMSSKSSNKIQINYRTYGKCIPPRRCAIHIPGWAGDATDHTNGSVAKPLHCIPFVEGSTYGVELLYSFDTTTYVTKKNGKILFEGEWEKEDLMGVKYDDIPPFGAFAEDHYGMTSSLDIHCPKDHIIRLEPHPSFYTDPTYSIPWVVPGHIQSEWWSSIFFVVFKAPPEGHTHVFQKGKPYAQMLVLPRKVDYSIEKMTKELEAERNQRNTLIFSNRKKYSKNIWKDSNGKEFDDKYKQIKNIFEKHGIEAVDKFLSQFKNGAEKTALKRKLKLFGCKKPKK
jgi:hypothetical protein